VITIFFECWFKTFAVLFLLGIPAMLFGHHPVFLGIVILSGILAVVNTSGILGEIDEEVKRRLREKQG
jgi:hypothetical protein